MSKRKWTCFSKISDLSEEVFLIKAFGNKEVGGIKSGSHFKFYVNICPHAGAPICKGVVRDLIISVSNQRLTVDQNIKVIHCPWHGMEFNIEDGNAVAVSKLKLEKIEHKIKGEEIHIYI